jgi:hypothetical protein
MGSPLVLALMSTAPSPRSDTEPIVAREVVRTRCCISSRNSRSISTSDPTKAISCTAPTVTPATRTGDPRCTPAAFGNFTFRL